MKIKFKSKKEFRDPLILIPTVVIRNNKTAFSIELHWLTWASGVCFII